MTFGRGDARTRPLHSARMVQPSEWTTWRWLVGGFAIAAVAAPMAFVTLEGDLSSRVIAWWCALALFLVGWIAAQRIRPDAPPGVARLCAIAVQSAAAIACNALVPTVFPGVATGGVLLVIVAAQLGGVSAALGITWTLVQSVILLAIYLDAWPPSIALTAGVAYAAFQFGMLGVARLGERERSLRTELAGTVAELLSTRSLLESTTRHAERMRIARELHDLLGHHLVGLNLQLEAAIHETRSPADAPVGPADERMRSVAQRLRESRALASLLLADVRAAVSDLRTDDVDLVTALRSLGLDVPGPAVEFRLAPGFGEGDPERATAFLRCAQEAITNARRHSAARRVLVEGDGDVLIVRDDGRGVKDGLVEGAGLRGMRERVERLGGTVSMTSDTEGGTRLEVRIPRGGTR